MKVLFLALGMAFFLGLTSCETNVMSISKAEISESNEITIKPNKKNVFTKHYQTKDFTRFSINDIVLKNIEITSLDGAQIEYLENVSVYIKTPSGSQLIAQKDKVSTSGNFIGLDIEPIDLNYLLSEDKFEVTVVSQSSSDMTDSKALELFTEFSLEANTNTLAGL